MRSIEAQAFGAPVNVPPLQCRLARMCLLGNGNLSIYSGHDAGIPCTCG